MTFKYVDSVQQFATGVGTAGLTLGSPTYAYFRDLVTAGMANGDTTRVRIQHADLPSEWEVVLVTYNAGAITRTFDARSFSSTGALINFSAGNKIVSGVITAAEWNDIDAIFTADGTGTPVGLHIGSGDILKVDGNVRLAINSTVEYQAAVAHQAGNAGHVTFGIADGGGESGVTVENNWGGTYSSQEVVIKTAHGGVSSTTERLRVDKDGNVTIGSTAARATLKLTGADSTQNIFLSGVTKGLRFVPSTTQFSIEATDYTGSGSYQPLNLGGSYIAYSITGTEKMRLDASGRLGIGKVPTTALLETLNTVDGTAGNAGTIHLYDDNAGLINGLGTSAGAFDFRSVGQFGWYSGTGPTLRMKLDGIGQLGIGTTPGANLHVKGAGQTTGAFNTGASLGSALYLQDTGVAAGNGGAVMFGAGQGAFAAIKGYITDGANNTAGHVVFSTRGANADATLTERMRLTYDGKLGIGGSPSYQLDVIGTVAGTFNGLRVANGSTNAAALSRFDIELSSIANAYALHELYNNSGTPYYQISLGAGVIGGFTLASVAQTQYTVNGVGIAKMTTVGMSIGTTTSPTRVLDVAIANAAATDYARIYNSNTGTGAGAGLLLDLPGHANAFASQYVSWTGSTAYYNQVAGAAISGFNYYAPNFHFAGTSGGATVVDIIGTDNANSLRIWNTAATKFFTFKPETATDTIQLGYWNGSTFANVSLQGSWSATTQATSDNSQLLATTAFVKNAIKGTTNAQTGTSYTLQASDNGNVVTMSNAAANTVTFPAGLGANFSTVIIQIGAGQTTVAAGASTTVNSAGGLKARAQWSALNVFAYAADASVVNGDTTT